MALPALPFNADTRSITERVNVLIRNWYNLVVPVGAANTVLTSDGSKPVWSADTRTLQVVNTQTGAVATGTTTIPPDDTIPQNTEGDQYMSLAITPKSASSKLKIEADGLFAHTANPRTIMALFRDSAADALAVRENNGSGNSVPHPVSLTHIMDSPGTSATTFKIRAGGASAGTLTFNGRVGGRLYGDVMASRITITEYLP